MTLNRINRAIVFFGSLACGFIALAKPDWVSDSVAIALFVLAAIGLVITTTGSSGVRDADIQDAVRKAGPDALPSRVYEEIIGRDASFLRTLFGPSLARVMSSLHSLSERGLLTETTIVDQQGRSRKAYNASEAVS